MAHRYKVTMKRTAQGHPVCQVCGAGYIAGGYNFHKRTSQIHARAMGGKKRRNPPLSHIRFLTGEQPHRKFKRTGKPARFKIGQYDSESSYGRGSGAIFGHQMERRAKGVHAKKRRVR